MTKREKSKTKKKKSVKRKKVDINLDDLSNLSYEGMLSDMFGDVERETPLRKAQDIIYDAGMCSASPPCQGGVEGAQYETIIPYREVPPVRAGSFSITK